MKGDGGNGSEEKGRAERRTPATRESSEDHMEKDSWQREPSRLGLVAAGLLGTALDTGTPDSLGREQGARAEGEEGGGGPPAILAGCTPGEAKRTPEVRIWHHLWADSTPTSSPATPSASQPQTKTGASKAAQKVAGWWKQRRGKDRTGGQTDRQTDEMSQHSSLKGHHFLIRTSLSHLTESDVTKGSVCWGRGGGRNHPILGEKNQRERHTPAVKQREKEGYYIISTFFPPPLK